MNLRILLIGSVLISASSVWAAHPNQQVIEPEFMKPAGSRTFAIEYVGKATEIPPGTKKLRLWFPVPQGSTVQTIREVTFSKPAQLGTEQKYGNSIAYWEFENPGASVDVTMKFVCERKEVALDLSKLAVDGSDDSKSFEVYKNPDKLVVIDNRVKRIAGEVTEGKSTTLEKGRAIYQYVLRSMVYDKNHAGWGFGSTAHACEMGKGNCTDFHALFNSLCRAAGIASGFEIGLYLPYEQGTQETLGGYHCWALFRVPGKTWAPVDCSEASRFSNRKETFFGGHTSNRVTLSTGRDITLEPKQDGPPLNYFLNPYAEADGTPAKTEKSWNFKDLI